MAALILRSGPSSAREFPLGRAAVIGRSAQSECFLDSTKVSRRHASIEERDGRYHLRDLGSKNGTLHNGRMLRKESPLQDGDRIEIGGHLLEFQDRPADASSPTPEAGGAAAAPPRRLGKFQISRLLGKGGMGEVFLAIDDESKRQIAVKLIRSDTEPRHALLEYFHSREGALAQQIQHPNIIQILEHGICEHQPFIAMEYVAGESLQSAMEKRRLQPGEVLEIIRQAACGLHAAHRVNVVHCDIKPANILLCGPARRENGTPADPARDSILELGDGAGEEEAGLPGNGDRTAAPPRYEPALLAEIQRRSIQPNRKQLDRPPFWGRLAELRFLEENLESFPAGQGGVLLIEGEAGSGRSRLLAEFIERLRGGEEPSGGGKPLQAVDLDIGFNESRAAPASPCSPAAPLLVRLHNLGKLTSAGVGYLESLLPAIRNGGLILAGQYTPGEARRNPSLLEFFKAFKPFSRQLFLRPLTRYQVECCLQSILPPCGRVDELAADLFHISRGNFGRLVRTLGDFLDRGHIRIQGADERWTYEPNLRDFELVDGRHQLERFGALGKIEQGILEHAAAIGPAFYFDLLKRARPMDETSLFLFLKGFLSEGFLEERGHSWFAFTNRALQQHLADRIPEDRRAQNHRQIAGWLEDAPVAESLDLFELRSRHYLGSGEYLAAARCLLQGARLARMDYQFERARKFYQETISLYRRIIKRDALRRELNALLRREFGREGNWYEILGNCGAEEFAPILKITDFGISFRAMSDRDMRDGAAPDAPVGGTPRYMAPERGTGEDGQPVLDIFSLGIIAYELATGAAPYPDLKGLQVFRAYKKRPVAVPQEKLSGYPPGFSDLLRGMLEPEPARRWSAARIVDAVTLLQRGKNR